jgi:gliding motility associated protien GldN
MNLYRRYTLLFCSLSLSFVTEVFPQTGSTTVNPAGVKPKKYAKDVDFEVVDTIRQEDKMYQISVWRRIDLQEKFNLPLYGSGDKKDNGIMKHIRDAVVVHGVKAYKSDILYPDTLDSKKEIGVTDFEKLFDFTDYNNSPMSIKNLYFLDLKEDFVFDRHHSRFKFDIKYIALVKPEKVNINALDPNSVGAENIFAYIPYKELMEHFEAKKIQGVWINFKNVAEPKTYPEAFNQRMFRSVVVKFTNEFDKLLLDFSSEKYNRLTQEQKNKYGPAWPKLQAFFDAMAFEYKLVDFENSVWEW